MSLEKIACVAGGIVVPGVTFLAEEPLREAIAVKPRWSVASGSAAQNYCTRPLISAATQAR